jgi:hypothetical protein
MFCDYNDNKEVGPLSHWLEDSIEDDGAMVLSSWKDEPDNMKELCLQLRCKTGMGLLNAKQCLLANNYDIDKAYENHLNYKWDGKLRD